MSELVLAYCTCMLRCVCVYADALDTLQVDWKLHIKDEGPQNTEGNYELQDEEFYKATSIWVFDGRLSINTT